MKVLILFITVFFGFNLFSQSEVEKEQEIISEEQIEDSTLDTQDPVRSPQRQQDKIQVECVCPAPAPQEQVVEEEQAVPQVFPDNAVFNITPAPEVPTVDEQEKEEFHLPPGYLQELPPGFSNDQYKRIEPY